MRESVALARPSSAGRGAATKHVNASGHVGPDYVTTGRSNHYQKLSNKYEKNYDISQPTLSMEIDIVRKSPITGAGCKIIREVLYEENLHIEHIKLVTECCGPLPRMDHYKQMPRCHEMMLKIGGRH